jgi:hypothetical protein
VSELWVVWKEHEQLLGVLAAVVFAIVNADAVLVVNTDLRGESPVSMTLAIMFCGTVLGVLATGVEVWFGRGEAADAFHSLDAPPAVMALAFALSFGMPLMLVFRNAGFALSRDTTVAQVGSSRVLPPIPPFSNALLPTSPYCITKQLLIFFFTSSLGSWVSSFQVLYLEIVFAFVWQVTFLGSINTINVYQLTGAAVIIVGSCVSVQIKAKGSCIPPPRLLSPSTQEEQDTEMAWNASKSSATTNRKAETAKYKHGQAPESEVEFGSIYTTKDEV